jgi:hypothetical protein
MARIVNHIMSTQPAAGRTHPALTVPVATKTATMMTIGTQQAIISQ